MMKREDNIYIERSVQLHLTEALYETTIVNLISVFSISSILYFVLRSIVDPMALKIWYTGFSVVLLFRFASFFWYKATKDKVSLQQKHYHFFSVGALLTAVFLGVLGSFLMPENIVYQVFVLILIVGVVAGSVQSLYASFLTNISYIYLTLFPILLWQIIQILENKEIYIFIFLSMVIFCVFSFVTAKRGYLLLVNHMELEYRYKNLLDTVSKMKDIYKEQATHDVLTKLYNRQFLNEYLEIELMLAGRESKSLSIIMVDLDFFKRFNDSYGHETGDRILEKIGEILHQNIRKSDVACRYGGEEFMIILPDTTLEGAHKVAEIIRSAVSRMPIVLEKVQEHLTASFGIASFPQHALTQEALIAVADKALYKAKKEGRNRVYLAP